MAKRSRAVIFLLLGFVLLTVAGGWYFYNIKQDQIAGKQTTQILNEFEKQDNNASVITVGEDNFCGKVCIEKLGVELPVYNEWSYKKLKTAPCRYTGGISTNDIIIAAHNYKSHFGRLNTLQIGDEIVFIDAYSTEHTYKVCEITKLDGTAVSDMHSGGWDFTLFTCTKGGKQRVTVRCERK